MSIRLTRNNKKILVMVTVHLIWVEYTQKIIIALLELILEYFLVRKLLIAKIRC